MVAVVAVGMMVEAAATPVATNATLPRIFIRSLAIAILTKPLSSSTCLLPTPTRYHYVSLSFFPLTYPFPCSPHHTYILPCRKYYVSWCFLTWRRREKGRGKTMAMMMIIIIFILFHSSKIMWVPAEVQAWLFRTDSSSGSSGWTSGNAIPPPPYREDWMAEGERRQGKIIIKRRNRMRKYVSL